MANRNVYHVMYRPDRGQQPWKVEKESNMRPSGSYGTKRAAVKAAKRLAKNNRPGQVIVHYKSRGAVSGRNAIQTEYTYPDTTRDTPG